MCFQTCFVSALLATVSEIVRLSIAGQMRDCILRPSYVIEQGRRPLSGNAVPRATIQPNSISWGFSRRRRVRPRVPDDRRGAMANPDVIESSCWAFTGARFLEDFTARIRDELRNGEVFFTRS